MFYKDLAKIYGNLSEELSKALSETVNKQEKAVGMVEKLSKMVSDLSSLVQELAKKNKELMGIIKNLKKEKEKNV